MVTKRLRNTVMERLGPGCTKDFFDKHIAKIPEGRQYEAVPNRDAYISSNITLGGLGCDAETILELSLLQKAVKIIRNDSKPHKSEDVFAQVLESNPGLGDFFRAGNPNDFAQFNKLIMDNLHIDGDEAIGEGIALVKRRPITWQYQG